jgi:Tfp pilus assembly protein PilN
MTAPLTPPQPAGHAVRMPTIAANLLPVEITQARRLRAVRRLVLSGLLAVALALTAWYGLAVYDTRVANQHLRVVQKQAQKLEQGQRAYDELKSTQAESDRITARLAALLADDLQWSRLLAALREAAPPGVEITGVSGAITPAAKRGTGSGKGRNATPAPAAPAGQRTIGTLTVVGTGATKAAVAGYVDLLAGVRGLANPMLASATVQDDVLQFTVRTDLTNVVLDSRYPATSPTPSGRR